MKNQQCAVCCAVFCSRCQTPPCVTLCALNNISRKKEKKKRVQGEFKTNNQKTLHFGFARFYSVSLMALVKWFLPAEWNYFV